MFDVFDAEAQPHINQSSNIIISLTAIQPDITSFKIREGFVNLEKNGSLISFYRLPDSLAQEIEKLESAIDDFKNGSIHPIRFRGIRVPFGVYEQRKPDTFMMRIRCTAGGATPVQLVRVGELAKKFGKPLIHVTTRQEMQLHDIQLDDVPDIMRELMAVGLSCRGGGGNTVRNIMASSDSGINPAEVFDVSPYAVSLSSRLIADPDSWNLPRKLKISFSSLKSDNALAVFNDLGFIAKQKNEQKGFQVWVAGGMGCRPRVSRLLFDFIPEDKVVHVCTAIKNLFFVYGNRKNKNSNRLRFLWDELGQTEFMALFHKEYDNIESRPDLKPEIQKIENHADTQNLVAHEASGAEFKTWKQRYVSSQKQVGLNSIRIPLNLGDLNADDAIKLGHSLSSFGENVLRFTMQQNILVRNIPDGYLGNIFQTVSEIESLSFLPAVIGNMVSCAGADTCTTGVCLSRDLTAAVQLELLKTDMINNLPGDLNINVSGCPNSCGQHHIGDLGLFGRVARKNGRVLPAYWVVTGANLDPAAPRLAEKVGWIPAKSLPAAITEILKNFEQKQAQFINFRDYLKNGGRRIISDICTKYQEEVPTFEEDNRFYFDWGDKSIFTINHMEHGECSAGVFDMIEVEMDAIKSNRHKLQTLKDRDEIRTTLWNVVYSAANMLLITRGSDPSTENEVFDDYKSHFFDTGLIPASFKEIVTSAQIKDLSALENQKDKVCDLGDVMIQLYHKMDNSLRFPGDPKVEANAEEVSPIDKSVDAKSKSFDKFKDLRGVTCPMNFVKTKVELAGLTSGQTLEILLDDGEPIENVPRSVKSEGHLIVLQEKTENYWRVVIEKA